MIKINSDKLSINDIEKIHEFLCDLHKTDYNLSISNKQEFVIASMWEN